MGCGGSGAAGGSSLSLFAASLCEKNALSDASNYRLPELPFITYGTSAKVTAQPICFVACSLVARLSTRYVSRLAPRLRASRLARDTFAELPRWQPCPRAQARSATSCVRVGYPCLPHRPFLVLTFLQRGRRQYARDLSRYFLASERQCQWVMLPAGSFLCDTLGPTGEPLTEVSFR